MRTLVVLLFAASALPAQIQKVQVFNITHSTVRVAVTLASKPSTTVYAEFGERTVPFEIRDWDEDANERIRVPADDPDREPVIPEAVQERRPAKPKPQADWPPAVIGRKSMQMSTSGSSFVASVLLTGLPADTQHVVRAVMGSDTSPAVTFQTARQTSAMPRKAERFSIAPPADWGVDIPINADCSNIGDVLKLIGALAGPENRRIVLEPGTECTGQFVFPARPNHSGWIEVTTKGFDARGRVDPKTAKLARFVSNAGPWVYRTVSIPKDKSCYQGLHGEGNFFYHSGQPSTYFPVLRCSDKTSPIWQQAPHHIGTADGQFPQAAKQYDWCWKCTPQVGSYPSLHWMIEPGKWQQIAVTRGGIETEQAVLQIPEGAGRIRFTGIEATALKHIEPGPPGWDTPAEFYHDQGLWDTIVISDADDVIWDRVYIHGHPKPNRYHKAISLSGDRVAIVDSVLNELHAWAANQFTQFASSTAIAHYSGGPSLIANNELSASGIPYFAPNTPYTEKTIPHDVVIEDNDFLRPRDWRQADDRSWNMPNRNSFELKFGEVYEIRRNTFSYQWAGINQGATLLFTPRCSAPPSPAKLLSIDNKGLIRSEAKVFSGDIVLIAGSNSAWDGLHEVAVVGPDGGFTVVSPLPPTPQVTAGTVQNRLPGRRIRDITIEDNMLWRGTEIMRVAGQDRGCSFAMGGTQRMLFRNNVAVDHNVHRYTLGGRVDQNGTYGAGGDNGSRFIYYLNGEVEDITIDRNLVYGFSGNLPTMFVGATTPGSRTRGATVTGNVFVADSIARALRSDSAQLYGAQATDLMMPDMIASGNQMCCGSSPALPNGFSNVPIESVAIPPDQMRRIIDLLMRIE